jgi:hypothetical protein
MICGLFLASATESVNCISLAAIEEPGGGLYAKYNACHGTVCSLRDLGTPDGSQRV